MTSGRISTCNTILQHFDPGKNKTVVYAIPFPALHQELPRLNALHHVHHRAESSLVKQQIFPCSIVPPSGRYSCTPVAYASSRRGALSRSSLTMAPSCLMLLSWPNKPGTETSSEIRIRQPMMTKAKIHWNAITLVANWASASANCVSADGLLLWEPALTESQDGE
jgi:hypothetical protein